MFTMFSTARTYPPREDDRENMEHWIPGFFIYFVVLFTVIITRAPVSEWTYKIFLNTVSRRGHVALPPDTDADTLPTVSAAGQVAIGDRLPPLLTWPAQGLLIVPIFIGLGGVILPYHALDAEYVRYDCRRDNENSQNCIPSGGTHWYTTELIIWVSFVYITVNALIILARTSPPVASLLFFARRTQKLGVALTLIPLTTFAVSVGVTAARLLAWYPFSGGMRIVWIAVVGQSLMGAGVFTWGCVVRRLHE